VFSLLIFGLLKADRSDRIDENVLGVFDLVKADRPAKGTFLYQWPVMTVTIK